MNAPMPLNPVAAAFAHHQHALQKYLARRLSTPEDAKDLAQEVFLQALQLKRADLVRDPGAYLNGMAAFMLSQFGRRIRSGKVIYSSRIADLHAHELQDDSAEELQDAMALERRIVDALLELPRWQLKVLMHELRDGMTRQQIAARCGLHQDSVRQYSARAMGTLRRRLALPIPGQRR